MRSRDVLRSALLGVVVAACAKNTAPQGFLPEPKQAGAEAHGGWVELSVSATGALTRIAGELLAVTADSIWIATRPDSLNAPNAGYVVARRAISEGTLTWYKADPTQIGVATALGTASTISNGAFLIFTGTAWILTGSIGGPAYTRTPVVKLAPDEGRDLRSFARFPAGIPVGLDASFRRIGEVTRVRTP